MTTPASLQTFARACRFGWLALAVGILVASPAARSQVRNIDVVHDGDTYVVTVQVFAPVNRAIAWEVLTDFPNMAGWVPNLRESIVVKPGDRQMTIEQRGTAKFGGVGFSYTSVREIVLEPQTTIRSTQVKGRLRKQESLMTLSSEGDGTRMQYRLELVPSLLASAALSQDRLRQEIEEQFSAIVGEMTKRRK